MKTNFFLGLLDNIVHHVVLFLHSTIRTRKRVEVCPTGSGIPEAFVFKRQSTVKMIGCGACFPFVLGEKEGFRCLDFNDSERRKTRKVDSY